MASSIPDTQTGCPGDDRNDISALTEELKTDSELRGYIWNVAESIVTPAPSTSPPISASPSPRKRSLPGDAIVDDRGKAGNPLAQAERATPSKDEVDENRDEKPCPASSSPKPTKRRKLTAAEREEKQREREEREQQRAEKRVRWEEERRVREEERRQKEEKREEERQKREADREERRRLKEAEMKAKEDKKREEDEEKARKERAQTRLNNFFPTLKGSPEKNRTERSGKPPTSALVPGAVPSDNISGDSTPTKSLSPQKSVQQPAQSDYDSSFLPFYVQAHVVLAPWNRFGVTRNPQLISREIDKFLQNGDIPTRQKVPGQREPENGLWHTRWTKNQWARYKSFPRVKELLGQITGSVDQPIDLTTSTCSKSVASPTSILEKLPIKLLQYAEDFRPAYRGTFSRLPAAGSALRLGKNPFEKSLPDTDYGYDSEAEWVEPEEGEDLDSEGEEDVGSDEDDEEMEEFLDDEGLDSAAPNPGNKRRLVNGDLIPICSGLCWEGAQGVKQLADVSGSQPNLELGSFRMELLLDNPQLPIDPYSASYWQTSAVSSSMPMICREGSKDATRRGLYPMDPPRVPLHAINRASAPVSQLTLVDSTGKPFGGASTSSKAGKRIISSEYLDDFKSAVKGSDLTKTGLIEVLKKKFPKASKDVIKDTLTAVATRVGPREADKRWILIDGV